MPSHTAVSRLAAINARPSHSHRARILGAALVALGAASGAQAQWTVVSLHPAGGTNYSAAWGVGPAGQAGVMHAGILEHASVWNSTAASWVDLNPTGIDESFAYAIDGNQQAGNVKASNIMHAALWTGTPESWVDLNPTGATSSRARAAAAGWQGGEAWVNSRNHASLWNGTPESWIDLHPGPILGITSSVLMGMDGGPNAVQVGSTTGGGAMRASLWHGTAASWTDLTPPGTTASIARAVHAGQQVGAVMINGEYRAALWSGSAGSYVSLHPNAPLSPPPLPSINESYATCVHAHQQAGGVRVLNMYHAALWNGTADSWVDLHTFLPEHFTESFAYSIWHDENATYVAGFAEDLTTFTTEALLWIGPPPARCRADFNLDGQVNSQDFFAFLQVFFLFDPAADFNADGAVNSQDFFDFLGAMFAGC